MYERLVGNKQRKAMHAGVQSVIRSTYPSTKQRVPSVRKHMEIRMSLYQCGTTVYASYFGDIHKATM